MKTWNDYPVTLTVDEAADLLNISRRQNITDRCKSGEFPAINIGGAKRRNWRIDRDRLRMLFAPKQGDLSLAEQLGEIELALSTLATVHRDEPTIEKLLRVAHAATLAAYNQAREGQENVT